MSEQRSIPSNLSPERRALLALKALRLKEQSETPEHSIPQLPRGEGTNIFPLSPAQERLWFLDQLVPGSSAFNLNISMRVQGPLDVSALKKSFIELARRHEVLRTNLKSDNGRPAQVIPPAPDVRLKVVHLSDGEAEARRLAAAEANEPFDLAQDPLLRAVLFQLGERDHVVLVIFHHVVFDMWSAGIFIRELAALYESFVSGQPPRLKPLPLQYADFSVWQRQWLESDDYQNQLDYWKRQLGGELPKFELPIDHPRPPSQTSNGAQQHWNAPKSLADKLNALSSAEGVTLFITLLTAFKTLIYRYTGQPDILVGSLSAGRNRSELEGLIGFFINLQALRTNLKGAASFREALARVRDVVLNAHANQDVPFNKLIQELQPERDLSVGQPLFQVSFSLQNTPVPSIRLAKSDLLLTQFPIAKPIQTFEDLNFFVTETADGITGTVEYNTDLFEPETISRMIGHYRNLLEGIVADPNQSLSALNILTSEERRQLLVGWNETATDYPRTACLHELFEAQVQRTPDAIAVVCGEQQQTYAEIDAKANQLARYLRKLGAKPDAVVGICVERSADVVVAVLGVLKAGCAYVMLDPAYPPERLSLMLEDSEVIVLLTHAALRDREFAQRTRTLALDQDWEVIARESSEAFSSGAIADNLAYVIYTSGSTGRPKGSGLPHRVLTNLISWSMESVSRGLRTIQFSSLSFDVSLYEIFSTCCSGGTLFIIPESLRTDFAGLTRYVADHEIEKLFLPVVALQQIAEVYCEQPELFASLKMVIVAGEQPTITRPIARLFDQLKGCIFHNLYGPSETHVATGFMAKHPPHDWPTLPPIGRPIANTEIYVLDAEMQPAPIGVVGEVYIGGDCLARGYLNRPSATAEKFIPNPFGARGTRLYKTGDLARYLNDGNINFLGRADHQVKIRGHRIELSEIEIALGRHSCVRDAVVMAREDMPGEKRLVAYVIADPEQPVPTVRELRQFVQDRVPDYMVPAVFVTLEAFPQLPNGKVDRRALPLPDAGRAALDSNYLAPTTTAEKTLAEIWQHALRLDSVGVNDNFIELGGDSIMSFQVVARANRAGLKLNLKQFYEHPTIAELARLAETLSVDGDATSVNTSATDDLQQLEHLRKRPEIADAYFLSPLQQGMLFHDLSNPAASEYVEVVSFKASEKLDPQMFERAWQLVFQQHPILRTALIWDEFDEPVQVVHRNAQLKIERHDWSDLPVSKQQEQLDAYIKDEQRRTFNLSEAPLMHLSLIKLADDSYQFVWSYKHLILDGWSQGLVLRDLGEAYNAFTAGREPQLEEAPSYRDYIQWIRKKDLGSAEVFWRRTLKDVTAATAFRIEPSHNRQATESYGEQRLTLSLEASTSLRQLARQHGLTLNILTQGAWALLLSRYTGERQVVFGNTVSGRAIDLAGVEEMVGVFINTLPVRVDVNESEEVLSWLKRLQAEQAEARQYEYTPVAEVQKWSGTGKGMPLFESILVFGNQPDQGDGPWAFADRSLQRTGYPIQILFEPGEKLSLRLTYQTHLFDEASIERLLSHYRTVLEDLLGQPRQRLAQLSILSDQERRELLFDFNDTETHFPLDRCFHELFEEQVKQTPNAPAAVCGNEEVSYAELNARANGVAMFLAERCVGPDVLVALLANRGIAFLTSVLGILKAGGAYLPLDPQHPARRISEVLKQSGVSLVLSAPEFASTVSAAIAEIDRRSQPQVILLDEAFANGSISENLSSRSGRGNLAYVIYTSGSTGQPKGAMVEQAGMLNHLYAKITDLDLTPADTVAQTASQCFDISVWQFFAALLTGGCTQIFNDEIVRDPSQMLARLKDSGVSVLETVPSLLRMMVDEVESNKATASPMAELRWMIPTGEALPPALCRRWFDSHPQVPMLNAYGPTECSDDVSHYLIRNAPPEDTVNMPIGRPIANMRLYILRGWLQPVPIGLSGELYVGGVGVGRGYLNDPARTAEVFVPDPFSGEPGARLYKTGDQARHLADNNIEFMGRVDTQVKVRGFRIELGDIEFALSQHPDVGEVVVIVREEQPGDKRLVAYLRPRQEKLPSVDELEKYLHERLPDYMKPAAFVPLKAMPLTPNGKIDRRRLPAVQYTEHTREEAFTLPRNPVEQALARVWSEVLGVRSISVRDNFFRLGGDSILSIQVVAKAKQAGLRLTPAQLFSHQTIAELAEVAATITEGEVADTSSPTIATLTPIQEWFFEQDYPTPHHWNQSVLLQSREPIVSELMKRAVEALISHHDALRLRFIKGNAGWEQRIDVNGPAAFTSTDLSGLASEAEQLETLQREIAGLQSSLNFTHGPLLSVGHFSLGEKHHDRLLITVHHLVVDGVSWRILLEDLRTAYQQLARGEEISLPSRTTSYTRWATRLTEYAKSEEVRAEAAYWTTLVEQTHEPLPRDFATGENTVSSTKLLSVELGEDETQSLLRNVFGVSHTGIIDVLLAALLKTIAQWTGGNSLFAYLEGHGREEIGGGVDVSRTVGWFTTLYPLHMYAPGFDDVALLTSVKEQLRRLPNKGLGYGLLRYLNQNTETAARLRSAPEPEISFNYLGQFDQTISSTSVLTPAPESAGPLRSQEGLRGSLLDITSLVTNGKLRIDWHFSENVHRRETIERLAHDYIVVLKDLITLSGSGYTLEDFTHASLSRDELDGLLQTQDAVEDIYRLSPLQQGILFDLRFTPQSGAYAMQLTQTLKGRLNAGALKQALQQVVERHSILRTSFHWEGLDEAVQVVHRHAQLDIVEFDYTEKTERTEDYLQADRQRGFDLSKAPLMRASLLRTAEDSHEFVWSWHHLILDGWSFSILLKEIITIYNNLCDERVAPLRPARQYVDYIKWLEQQELSEAESYWRGVLRGISRTTVLAQHSGGDTLQVEKIRELSLETSGSMQQLAHNHGLTLNTLAQGAWALLLSRYTGEHRVVFGSPVSGRGIDLAGVEEMVGVFINTLPVRVDVDESEEVLSWLKRLQAEQAEARQYEYTPLTDVQRWSETEKGMPLFESLLVFKNTFTGNLIKGPKGGIEVTNARAEHKTSLPLRLEAEPGERFVFRMVYDTGKFSDVFIEQILQHLERLLTGMVSNPHQPLSELSLMTEKEQQQQQAFTDLASLEEE